ncbi:MAG: ABC transporter ATP-binding protein [Rickettsiaceae bacterium]|nr:ABC transporter ATP-binding protein [Rickettsiaceae bacterium]
MNSKAINNKDLLIRILNLLRPFRLKLIFAAISLIAVVICLLSIGRVIKKFIDDSASIMPFYQLVILIISFGAASFVRSFFVNIIAEYAASNAKKDAYVSMLYLDVNKIDNYSFSDLASRINSDSEQISKVVTDLVSFFIRNSLTSLGGVIMMLLTSPKLSLMSFLVIGIITFCARLLSKKIRELAAKAESAKSIASNIVLESVINYRVIRAFSAESAMIEYFDKLNIDAQNKVALRLKYRSIFFASTITSMLLTITGIVWYGNVQVQSGLLSSGTLASFLFYAFMTSVSFGGIIEMMGDLDKSMVKCSRLFEIISEKSESSSKDIISLKNESFLELRNISYFFSSGTISEGKKNDIISNINIKFEVGKFSVITGRSGLGKTTLLNLIVGIYSPEGGEFLVGSRTYKKFSPEMWGDNLAYVPQDPMLFSGTIIDNITFFEKNPDHKKVMEILEGLDLKEFVESLENGVFSETGSLSTKISGGQKQRIAIARALYKEPELLIMDEATSQLDEATETRLLNFVKKTLSGKTIICVAHRRGAIEKADIIINLEKS